MRDATRQQGERFERVGSWARWNVSMWTIMFGMDNQVSSSAHLETVSESDLAALMNAVKARDRGAFAMLYDTTVRRIFGLALRITGQQELAEEVVNDVYLQVWRQAHSYAPERGKVIAWLCILCRSRALDALRRSNTRVRQTAIDRDNSVPEQRDPYPPPDLLAAVEQGSAVHAALSKLNDTQRQLVALAYLRGYTHSELARFLEMPIGTVKTHLHRAMIKLKELMSNSEYGMGGSDE